MRDNPVAGDHHGHGVGTQRVAHCSSIPGPTHTHGYPFVGAQATIGYEPDSAPHSSLKSRARREVDGEVQVVAGPSHVLSHLPSRHL